MRSARSFLPPLATLALLALPATEAAAQGARTAAPPPGGGQQVRPPPPALPGLQSRQALEPIPPDPTLNLGPNEALFDAINRGDIAAAREAVSRGASMAARNALGLTPIDSAVDQGRTEIAFFLLSVRGNGGGSRAAPPPEAEAPPPPPRTARRAPERRPAPAAPAAEVQPALTTPRLWAGDGGAPIPGVGFLGFDAGRPAGAAPPEAARPASGRGRG